MPYAVPRPQLLIPLPEWVRIIRGEGDDVVLGLTDGTTITGADFLTTHIYTRQQSSAASDVYKRQIFCCADCAGHAGVQGVADRA